VYKDEFGYILGLEADKYDSGAIFILVESKNKIVGGLRINKNNYNGLPFENEGVKFCNYLKYRKIAEISKLAILKEYRTVELVENVYIECIEWCLSNDVDSVYLLQPKKQARLTQIICSKYNVKIDIVKNIFPGEDKLSIGEFWLLGLYK
jgi:hypothetical protein